MSLYIINETKDKEGKKIKKPVNYLILKEAPVMGQVIKAKDMPYKITKIGDKNKINLQKL